MAYPTSFDDSLSDGLTNSSATKPQHASHHNQMAKAIKNIQHTLGTNPQGIYATVKARLAAMDTAIAAHTGGGGGGGGFVTLTDINNAVAIEQARAMAAEAAFGLGYVAVDAVGDGSADDTAAFADAISAGKAIFVPDPDAEYLVDPAELTLDGHTFLGMGKYTTRIKVPDAPGTTQFMRMNSGRNVFSNLAFIGPDTYRPGDVDNYQTLGFGDDDGIELFLSDCYFFRCGDAIGPWNGKIQPITAIRVDYDADHLGDDCDEGSFIGGSKAIGLVRVYDSDFTGGGCQGAPFLTHAIYLGYDTPAELVGNRFSDWTNGSYVKFYGDSDGTPPPPSHQLVDFNYFGPNREGFEANMIFTPSKTADPLVGNIFDQGEVAGSDCVFPWGPKTHFVGTIFKGGDGGFTMVSIRGVDEGGLADDGIVTFDGCHFDNDNLVDIGIDAENVDVTVIGGSMRGDTYYKVFAGGAGATIRLKGPVMEGDGIHVSFGADGDLLSMRDADVNNATYVFEVQDGVTVDRVFTRDNDFEAIGGEVEHLDGAGAITHEDSKGNAGYADVST